MKARISMQASILFLLCLHTHVSRGLYKRICIYYSLSRMLLGCIGGLQNDFCIQTLLLSMTIYFFGMKTLELKILIQEGMHVLQLRDGTEFQC